MSWCCCQKERKTAFTPFLALAYRGTDGVAHPRCFFAVDGDERTTATRRGFADVARFSYPTVENGKIYFESKMNGFGDI